MKALLIILALSFFYNNLIKAQLNELDKSSIKSPKRDLSKKTVKQLIFSNVGEYKNLFSSFFKREDFFKTLEEFEKLKYLRFERFQYINSIDTFITFDPMSFDIIEHVVDYEFDLPFYAVLPYLGAFQDLEVLEVDFLDNDGLAEVCRRDFAWLVLNEGIEQEMILELLSCNKNKDPNLTDELVNEHFTMWNWSQNNEEIQPNVLIPPRVAKQKEVILNAYRMESETHSFYDIDSLSDEEYCALVPEFCDGFIRYEDEQIDTTHIISCGFWGNEDELIDTVFLKEIGAWPFEEDSQEEKGLENLQENLLWKAYQAKCKELYQLAFFEETEIDSICKKTCESTQIFAKQNIDQRIPVSYQKIQHSLWNQRAYYKDLWKVLQPWNVKPRSELFLDQLAKLKQLKKLSISNNYMLDIEALIELIAKELPNLEVLEINHCLLFNVPKNINQLQELEVLNLEYNLIRHLPEMMLPNLKILNVENNPIGDSY